MISRHGRVTAAAEEGLMFGRVLLVTMVLSTPFAVRMETASALDGTGQVPLVAVVALTRPARLPTRCCC